MQDLTERFMSLFQHNPTSHGVYMPTGDMRTEKVQGAVDWAYLFNKHFRGEQGLGLVPILPNSKAKWGAIDVDAHGDTPDIDLLEMEKEVKRNNLPLMVCRSKSGGCHLYVFLSEPMEAKKLRNVLRDWACRLGLPASVEIFPKQDTLQPGQHGNWINLCYFDHMTTNRYCVEGGNKVSLDYFIELAESRMVNPTTLSFESAGKHMEAPPCISRMISDGVDSGSRNICLFHFAVYARQAFPTNWEEEVDSFNSKCFTKPLRRPEVAKVKNSAASGSYKYKCNDEYIKTMCDSAMCVKRDFGIPHSELENLERFEHPEYGPLERMDSDPVIWILKVGGKSVELSTSELLSHRLVRIAATEQIRVPVPPMKEPKWFEIYAKLMESHRVVESAPELSIGNSIMARLADFVRNSNPAEPNISLDARWALLDGAPCIQEREGSLCAMFRGQDVIDYMKNLRMSVDASKFSSVLKSNGASNITLKMPDNKKAVRVWSIPLESVWDGDHYTESNINPEY